MAVLNLTVPDAQIDRIKAALVKDDRLAPGSSNAQAADAFKALLIERAHDWLLIVEREDVVGTAESNLEADIKANVTIT